MFGKCKVCQEKDKRIAELRDQILHLRSLVYPVNDGLTISKPDEFETIDQNLYVMDQEMVDLQQQQQEELEEVIRERDRILSGQYE